MTGELRRSFGPEMLRGLAWGRSFERGQGCAADGRVKRLQVGDEGLSATVRGDRPYRVRLWLEHGAPRSSCTCPVGADGLFCKHCVAAGLAAFGADAGAGDAGTAPVEDELRRHLEGLEKARLVDLLLERAADDELLRGRLELEAAEAARSAGSGGGPAGGAGGRADGVAAYRGVIRDVISPRGFVDHQSMYEYGRGIDGLVGSLAGLLADGFAVAVVELSEHALICLEDALGNVDDSSGHMSDTRDRLVALHHQACLTAKPDPVALAERLFDWAMRSDMETFLDAAVTHRDVLGEAGLAAYRSLAEDAWSRTPALAPGEERDHSTERFTITFVMQTLAELEGDVDALIAVKERDLSSPYHFLEIAEICVAAGRHDDALAWAERGLAAFPECADTRLLDLLANEYERRGRGEDAMFVMWGLLDRRPVLDSYQRLKTRAARAGLWGAWRARALDRLRERERSVPVAFGWGPSADRSEVVGALLWEGDADTAWQEAVAGGCSASLWMTLARAWAVDHPEDAVPIYERQVERSIAEKTAPGYADAVAGLRAVRELLARLGRGDEFPARVAVVRAVHKQKRNLMKLLDEAGW